MTDTITINSEIALAQAQRQLAELWKQNKYLEVDIRRKAKQRTLTQNRALHLFCQWLADTLNEAGYDQRAVLAEMREGVSIPWQAESIKDALWRPVQRAVAGKESSAQLTTQEIGEVYEILNRWLAEKFGVSVAFPERRVA